MDNRTGAFLLCVLPGFLCGLPMLVVLATALLTRYLERVKRATAAFPWQSFLLGLVNAVFWLAIAIVMGDSASAALKVIAALIVLILLLAITLIGLPAAANIAGERVLALLTDRPNPRMFTLVVGILCLGISALLPIVGWLAVAVLVLTGLGAALLALLRPKQIPPAPPPAEASSVPKEPAARAE